MIFRSQGVGLFLSVHFRRPIGDDPDVALADRIAQDAVRRGVLMFSRGRGYLKFTPPLCIDVDAALEAVEVIWDCLRERIVMNRQRLFDRLQGCCATLPTMFHDGLRSVLGLTDEPGDGPKVCFSPPKTSRSAAARLVSTRTRFNPPGGLAWTAESLEASS